MSVVRVIRVFNNNVLLAADPAGEEIVVMGRGLAFQQRPGDLIDDARIERRFVLDGHGDAEGVARFVSGIPAEDMRVIEAIVELAARELGLGDATRLFLPLADHVAFAIRRAQEGTTFVYPLRTEVNLLYPREVAVARKALDLIRGQRGIDLSDVEATPLALHFVNAQIGTTGDVSAAVEMTETITAVLDLIGELFGIELSEDRLDVARFVTHLRYIFIRQARGTQLHDDQGALLAALRSSEPRAVEAAVAIQELLAVRLNWAAAIDEQVYLALHVARLTHDVTHPDAAEDG
jgi:beta-glucoside operon transcriptional antiterminator